MKIKYLGTAAAEGVPAIFCRCEVCRKSKAAGGRNIRTRSQSIIDDRLLLDFGIVGTSVSPNGCATTSILYR